MLRVSSHNPLEIIHFVLSRIGMEPISAKDLAKITAIGAYRGNKIIGGFVYTNYRKVAKTNNYSIDMHMAGSPGWLTPMSLRAFFAYPFIQLGCSRVVGSICAGNDIACSLAVRLGCKQDGRIRSGVSPDSDTIVYTMLRGECPWIRGMY